MVSFLAVDIIQVEDRYFSVRINYLSLCKKMFYVAGYRDEGIDFTRRVIFYNGISNVLVRSNASLAFSSVLAFICVGLDLRVFSRKLGLALVKNAVFFLFYEMFSFQLQ